MYQQNKNAPSKMYFSTLCSLWIFFASGHTRTAVANLLLRHCGIVGLFPKISTQ